MSRKLEEYRGRRRFEVTPEPPPEEPLSKRRSTPQAPRFMVHKHDATRVHYDLRLEMEGALASWAIPKGPSYNPADKRLAVQTEDHPLAYSEFEGRIPEGEYGAGDSIIWDRGTFRTDPPGAERQQRQKGHLRLRLEGEKLRGLWHLVRTRPSAGKQQWLFFKGSDELARTSGDIIAERPESVVSGRRITRGPVSARMLRRPHPPPLELLAKLWPPELATAAAPADLGDRPWVFEVKYDGFRALAAMAGGRATLQSRVGLDLAGRFPEIGQALPTIKVGEAVIDGEIVALDKRGVSKFELLQQGAGALRLVAFDLLWLEGEDLRQRPLRDRRELLESVLANAQPPIQLAERIPGSVQQALERARRRGLEGLIAKRPSAPYRGGRTREWLKLKLLATQDVVIGGLLPISTGARQVGALLVAVRSGKDFLYVGRVGTGFTTSFRADLFKRLTADAVDHPKLKGAPRIRDAVWVEPRLVGQVAFSEWTSDGKLRQPSFQGLRTDKTPEECVREAAVPRRRTGYGPAESP